MEIKDKKVEGNVLKIKTSSKDGTLFYLLKVYLQSRDEVDVAGTYEGHHLVDEAEFYLRVKEGNDPEKIFKEVLSEVKKNLENKKVK